MEFQQVAETRLPSAPLGLDCAAGGGSVAVAVGSEIRILDSMLSEQVRWNVSVPSTILSYCPNANLIATSTGRAAVDLFDPRSGKRVKEIRRDDVIGSLSQTPTKHFALYPNGKHLLATTGGSRIVINDVESGRWEHIYFVKYDGCNVCISGDGQYVLLYGSPKAAELSGHITLYRVRRGLEPLWTAWHDDPSAVRSASVSIKLGSVVSCSSTGQVCIWDLQSGKRRNWSSAPSDTRAAWLLDSGCVATVGADLSVFDNQSRELTWGTKIDYPSGISASDAGDVVYLTWPNGLMQTWLAKDSSKQGGLANEQ